MYLPKRVFAVAAIAAFSHEAQTDPAELFLHSVLSDGSTGQATSDLNNGGLATFSAHSNSEMTLVNLLDASFLNFDPDIDVHVEHKAQLLQGWKDAVKLASIACNDGHYGRPPFSDYFALSDGQSVKDTFYNIYDGDENVGSPHLRSQIFDNVDYAGLCAKPRENDDSALVIAYIANYAVDGRPAARTHICHEGYTLPAASELTCNSLGDVVSTRMNILGGILLQQWMHLNEIGKETIHQHIGNVPNVYGPAAARELFPNEQVKNAANYRWFALETYWSVVCEKTFLDPRAHADADDDQ